MISHLTFSVIVSFQFTLLLVHKQSIMGRVPEAAVPGLLLRCKPMFET